LPPADFRFLPQSMALGWRISEGMRPLQFTLRRIAVSVSIFAIGLAFARQAFPAEPMHSQAEGFACFRYFLMAGTCFGCSIGTFFKVPFLGAWVGLLAALVVGAIVSE
jgi:hypothetical protein